MKDEESIQRNVEQGKSDKSADSIAYESVFKALRSEPTSVLSTSFASSVMLKLQQQQHQKSARSEVVWAGVGIALSLLTFVAAVILTGFRPELGFLDALGGYKSVFVFGGAFIVLLQCVDKFLIRKKAAI
jgi:hypothetical protein